MRAYQLFEYRRDITAQNLGNKLVAALMQDRGDVGTLSQSRTYLDQKTKAQGEIPADQLAKIVDGILAAIEAKDPTKNKQYTQWMARMYGNGGVKLEDLNRNNVIGEYDLLKRRRLIDDPAHADINRFKTYTDFEDVIEWKYYGLISQQERTSMNKGKATDVYKDANVRIIVPEDQNAACYYGQGTRWCTAATQGQNYYSHYAKQGKMYILIPTKAQYDGEKYQLHFASGQFMNEEDSPIDVRWLLKERFPGTLEFFKKIEPGINQLIVFADPEVIEQVVQQVGELAMEHAWEMIYDWESSDDYYHQWKAEEAEKRGYVDADGDIDWERVHDDDELNNYLEFNWETQQWLDRVKDAVFPDAETVRDIAQDYAEHFEDVPNLSSMDDMIASSVQRNLFRGDDNIGMAEWITNNIWVRPDPPGADGKITWKVGRVKQ